MESGFKGAAGGQWGRQALIGPCGGERTETPGDWFICQLDLLEEVDWKGCQISVYLYQLMGGAHAAPTVHSLLIFIHSQFSSTHAVNMFYLPGNPLSFWPLSHSCLSAVSIVFKDDKSQSKWSISSRCFQCLICISFPPAGSRSHRFRLWQWFRVCGLFCFQLTSFMTHLCSEICASVFLELGIIKENFLMLKILKLIVFPGLKVEWLLCLSTRGRG